MGGCFGGKGRGEGGVGKPRFVSISCTSSRVTKPSLSRSRIWKPSRSERTWVAGSVESASLFAFGVGRVGLCGLVAVVVRVGDVGGSRAVRRARGVQSLLEVEGGVLGCCWSLEGGFLVGDGVGVVGWLAGEGEAGESGRLKGEVRGEP